MAYQGQNGSKGQREIRISVEIFTFISLLAAIAVVAVWCFCFFWAARAVSHDATSNISSLGQFGDTFGSINALFTGLALVGLVYTALLQRYAARLQFSQLEAQHTELQRQAKDSEENLRSSLRQSREQFLTARLNATTALLHAAEVRGQLATAQGGEQADSFNLREARREAIELRQRLSILLQEVNLGFDRDWDWSLQRTAIKFYLIELLTKYIHHMNTIDSLFKYTYEVDFILQFPHELRSLICLTRPNHFLVSTWLQTRLEALEILSRKRIELGQAEQWVTSTLHQVQHPSDQETWGDREQSAP